ncbi:hypothetical protein [Moumouvirus maliensis]|nr:hypothetical protein [Moumouvirus maliensis]
MRKHRFGYKPIICNMVDMGRIIPIFRVLAVVEIPEDVQMNTPETRSRESEKEADELEVKRLELFNGDIVPHDIDDMFDCYEFSEGDHGVVRNIHPFSRLRGIKILKKQNSSLIRKTLMV